MVSLGCVFFSPQHAGPRALVDLARRLEDGGIDALFLTEYQAEIMTLAAALAIGTERTMIGTAVANLYYHAPYELAMATANVQALANGRFVLGIGTGHADENVAWFGMDMSKPVSRSREYVAAVRALLDTKGPVTLASERYPMTTAAMCWPPDQRVPIWIGALGEPMTRLGGEADGIVSSMVTTDTLRRMRRTLGPEKQIASVLFCCIRPTRAEAREVLRNATNGYLTRPYYQASLRSQGIVAEGAFGDDDIDALMIAGPLDYARERLAELREAGVDLPLLAPPLRGEPDRDAAYLAFSQLSS